MKKLLLSGLAALCALAFTACNKSSDNSNVVSFKLPTYNHFSSSTPGGSVSVAPASYTYTTEIPAFTVNMSGQDLSSPTGNFNFRTSEIGFKVKYYDFNGRDAEVISFSSALPTENNVITDLKCQLTQMAYAPGSAEVPGYKRFAPNDTFSYTVMSYRYNGMLVRTFWPDMTYKGLTVTQGVGMPGEFTNQNMSYRVVMQRNDDNTLKNKADLIFYNAMFAQGMPELTIVVKDLDLKFTNMGYELTGTNISPYMVEGGELQPAPRFVFNEIRFDASGDLTSITGTYKVAGIYSGRFTGACIETPNS
ncbi:MAG: hypothetical protein K2N88_08875 [Muribaculaceae bacterium]|nr:hypothetical protein [Muribaculaceae bacterium]